jgi:polyisoprenyl-phosphate glycosyltransferase
VTLDGTTHDADNDTGIPSAQVPSRLPSGRATESMAPPVLTLVVPCYNEEPILLDSKARIRTMLDSLVKEERVTAPSIYFIDDGSADKTWELIEQLASRDPCVHGLKLSRNFGQQSAILSGLLTAPGDVLISLDADLQDDLESIGEMLDAYRAGAEVVYGIRNNRGTDSFFKRASAESYYGLLRAFGVKLVFNHADFRLLSRRVVEELRNFKESNLFLRGLIPQLGFRSALVYYNRQQRLAGESKYPLGKMISLALNGIVSFTDVPLKTITVLGILVSLFSFGMAAWALAVRFFDPAAVPGWASTVIPLYFLGGIQLLCLGVIGQYLAKLYAEVKARPRFIIEKSV